MNHLILGQANQKTHIIQLCAAYIPSTLLTPQGGVDQIPISIKARKCYGTLGLAVGGAELSCTELITPGSIFSQHSSGRETTLTS